MILQLNGVSVEWPEFMLNDAKSRGWAAPIMEQETDTEEVQMIANPCPVGMVQVRLPSGTKETGTVLKTPPWLGPEKWFTKTKLHAFWKEGDTWVVQAHPQEFVRRGLAQAIA